MSEQCGAKTTRGGICQNAAPYWDRTRERWTCWHHNTRTAKRYELTRLLLQERSLIARLDAVRKDLDSLQQLAWQEPQGSHD